MNRNDGATQTDVFLVNKEGRVEASTPIIWDFAKVTSLVAHPVDEKILTLRGGRFTTLANAEEAKYQYFRRGITIRRSRVQVERLEHRVTGAGKHSAPYGGFLEIRDCAHITVQDCVLSGHKTYRTIGAAEAPVSMGTYGITANRAVQVSFVNCRQNDDILDGIWWGVMASNYCKNLVLDRCVFSRFDAHMGVFNATIRGCTLGHQGINAIGGGLLIVEDSTIKSRHFITLRPDYGSTWDGEFIIKNCVFQPPATKGTISLITGSNAGQHDFGYPCQMPRRITVENLHIDDSQQPASAPSPAFFAKFQPSGQTRAQPHPYLITQHLTLSGINTTSGSELLISKNPALFEKLVLARK